MKSLVLGHRGMVGSAIIRHLGSVNIECRDYNLCNQESAELSFVQGDFESVYLCAAKVGGIKANADYPADFIRDNLSIQLNAIDLAYRYGVKKLLFLGSSCIYPKHAAQPITEDALMTGPLEPTNSAYAIAKIAGVEMCRAYRAQYGFNAISLMPTNLYGPGDKFTDDGHVIPGLIRRFHEAKESGAKSVTVWGSGQQCREFLHVDDLADAAVFLMEHYDEPEPINVGWGVDLPICALAQMIKEVVGFGGAIEFDTSKPDGTPRKVLNTSKLKALGWSPKITLREGLRSTYAAYCESLAVAA